MARALCLDLTRLLSRVGRGPLTGIDRVERAYADWVLATDPDPRFLVRTSRGYALFDRDGALAFLQALDDNGPWGKPDLLSRLTGKSANPRHAAEALLRRHALARCLPGRLLPCLSDHLRENTIYLNVGHSNLTDQTLKSFRALPDVRLAVFIHDVIPLEYPQYSSPGFPEHFAAMMSRVVDCADMILCNSDDTAARLKFRFDTLPPVTAAHLGLADLVPVEPLHSPVDADNPRFVALGTIEPRKNHALLLDVWEQLSDKNRPHLHIVGHRGWAEADLLARLDTHPLRNVAIFEHSGLTDGQVTGLLTGAHGLLFPTLAEGFGYPAAEAARLNVLPICANLPVLREILGDCGVYLDPLNAYSWLETIKKRSAVSIAAESLPAYDAPTWQAHFETVAAALWPQGHEGEA
jgi:glycosyltransferase involved in cell wall biosynthesis